MSKRIMIGLFALSVVAFLRTEANAGCAVIAGFQICASWITGGSEVGLVTTQGFTAFAGVQSCVVATNATLSKERAQLLAIAAHEGTSAAVRPAHTMWDGDTIFSLATGEVDAPQPTVEELAVNAVAEAIRRSVRLATPLAGVPTALRAGEAGLR